MRRTRIVCGGFLAAWLWAPAPALAQNRVDQQVFLDLRVVQEQNQQLKQVVNTLIDQLKTVNAKLETEANARNKGFADQQTAIGNITSNLSALQENVRDNKVQVQKVTQELEAIRKGVDMLTTLVTQALSQMPAAAPPVDPNAPPGSMPPAQPPAAGGVPASSKEYYDKAYADYAAGQHEMAIQGFEELLKRFPESPDAAQAQFFVGESNFTLGKFKEAVAAYDRVITNYKDSSQVPDAYYKQGICYDQLKQRDLMIKNFQLLRDKYPDSSGAFLAAQELKRLNLAK